MTYQEILELLHKHDCEVTFTKVDGTERVMPCTLREEAMPARDAAKFHETRVINEKVISAFCLDKMEWRSFRVENVRNIRVLDGN
jgi:hypothetical protein